MTQANDSYCRDTSIKIRSHFDVKRRNGEFIGSFAAYGYVKAPEDKNKLVIDDEAAAVVQDIFAWRLGGLSNQAIRGGHKTDKNRCTTHNISAARMETAVLAGVNFHIQSVADLQNALEAVSRRPGQKIELKKLNRRLVSLERELEKTQALKDALYRRFALGEIALEDFTEIKRIFNQDCGQVEHSILEQKKLLDGIQNSGSPDSPWIAHFQQFGQVEALTRAVTVKLIERVQVFEGGRVEITFRYQSEYEMSLQFLTLQAEALGKEAV